MASLDLLKGRAAKTTRQRLIRVLRRSIKQLWDLPQVGDIRQVGLIAGVELVADWRSRRPFELKDRAGIRVCEAMAERGVLTRPVGNLVVLMPPYCMTDDQVETLVVALRDSIREVL